MHTTKVGTQCGIPTFVLLMRPYRARQTALIQGEGEQFIADTLHTGHLHSDRFHRGNLTDSARHASQPYNAISCDHIHGCRGLNLTTFKETGLYRLCNGGIGIRAGHGVSGHHTEGGQEAWAEGGVEGSGRHSCILM